MSKKELPVLPLLIHDLVIYPNMTVSFTPSSLSAKNALTYASEHNGYILSVYIEDYNFEESLNNMLDSLINLDLDYEDLEELEHIKELAEQFSKLVSFNNTSILQKLLDISKTPSSPDDLLEFSLSDDGKILDIDGNFILNHQDELVDKSNFTALAKENIDNLIASNFSKLNKKVVGVICEVKKIVNIAGDVTHTIIEGVQRATLEDCKIADSFLLTGHIKPIVCKEPVKTNTILAKIGIILENYVKYLELFPNPTAEKVLKDVPDTATLDDLTDYISAGLQIDSFTKQQIIEELNILDRLEVLTEILITEIDIATIKNEISSKTSSAVAKNQRDYYLREELRVIQNELDPDFSSEQDKEKFLKLLEEKNPPEEVKEIITKEINKLVRISITSPEANVSRNYIETVLGLPWNIFDENSFSIRETEKILNTNHYGLDDVKERIIEYLAVQNYSKKEPPTILCLVGPPGVGKTTIAKSIAESINRKYVRLSLGGIKDESDIRGHRKTYVGAMAGRIMNSIKLSKTSNPLILLDEIDKLSTSYNGDPSSALLEVLDPEQNKSFRDHYLEIPYDLSKVLFICTANSLSTIPKPLLDRMEIITLSSYTSIEKFHIAKNHLIKKQRDLHGLRSKDLKISNSSIHDIIDSYTKEAGVRELEQLIGKICRKSVRKILEFQEDNNVLESTDSIDSIDSVENIDNSKSKSLSFTINNKNIEDFLGSRKYQKDRKNKSDQVGIVRGLAWTSVGGTTLSIEVNVVSGDGKFKFTGNVGKVMSESAEVALSYIRSKSNDLNLPDDFYKKHDIHVHIPEGATPKDGPSAGITMTTAIISAFTNTKIRSDVAMTGEITIRGQVLPIGGLKEKVLAAKKIGITSIVIPYDNQSDLLEISDTIKEDIDFTLAKDIKDVLRVAVSKGEKIWK